jgi:hypothetical protein
MAGRKKLKYMSKPELIEYANNCPGVKVDESMTVGDIMKVIPWKFRDHDGEEQTEEQPKETSEMTLEEREAALAKREAALAEKELELAAKEKPAVSNEPLPKGLSILEVVKVKDNANAINLRKYISMDGHYRYGLTDKQKSEADKLIEEIGCSKPFKREKKPVSTGF